MTVNVTELQSRKRPATWLGRVFHFPLVRMLVGVAFLVPVFVTNGLFKKFFLPCFEGRTRTLVQYAEAGVFFVLFILAYRVFAKYAEKRCAVELSHNRALTEMGIGFGISAGLVAVVVLLLGALGYYEVQKLNDDPTLAVDYLVKFVMGAFLEELIFRLLLFRLTEELVGSWLALLGQMLLFGLAHIGNENATLWTSFDVAIVGGLVETAAFMWTRRIWLAMGLHAGWNYFQSGIFGMPNSGGLYEGVLISKVSGPEWLTGGSFGIEASSVAIAFCLILGGFMLARAHQSGQIVGPMWRRR